MNQNKWEAEPFPEAPIVEKAKTMPEELLESMAEKTTVEIDNSLIQEIVINPAVCMIPPARDSIVEDKSTASIVEESSNYSPVAEIMSYEGPESLTEKENDGWGSEKSISAIFYTNKNRVEDLILRISQELNIAHSRKYDAVQAELTAALILETQKELSEFLADAELISKEKKAEVERIEAEQYFFYKNAPKEKITDVALGRMIAKDRLVLAAKKEQYQAESDYSKYKNLFGMLKEAHVFYRGLAKGKNDWT